jgi:hypothetical protein
MAAQRSDDDEIREQRSDDDEIRDRISPVGDGG